MHDFDENIFKNHKEMGKQETPKDERNVLWVKSLALFTYPLKKLSTNVYFPCHLISDE
jgi:hypothetical protein